jgi:hypothetical protein
MDRAGAGEAGGGEMKKRRLKIGEIAILLQRAVEVNEKAEKAHFGIARYFVGDDPKRHEELLDPIADAVADLQEVNGERNYREKARALVRNITGRNGSE